MQQEQAAPKPRRILPAREAYNRTGVSRGLAWSEERAGRFPKRIQITPFRVGYFEDEIDAWIESRPRALGRRSRCRRARVDWASARAASLNNEHRVHERMAQGLAAWDRGLQAR
jgi:prophage regulatory protein